MEARATQRLPAGPWRYEPKWDGFRCLAFKHGAQVALRGKSGKPLERYFPEIAAACAAAPIASFVLDGELAIPHGPTLDFDRLLARLHPAASRIARLARETPALLILFDCLEDPGDVLLTQPLAHRRTALEALHARLAGGPFRLSPQTTDRTTAEAWLARAGDALDGVIAKPAGAYAPGERAMLKVKQKRTAECVVGGFRYATGTRQVGSLLLGLYNPAGQLDHVGFTSGLAAAGRPALTRTLERLREPPGFTGNAPGGPSRWSTERSAEWVPLRPELVVEVCYDHVTAGRFRHGTALLRFRPDKPPRHCTQDQLTPESRPARLIDMLAAAG